VSRRSQGAVRGDRVLAKLVVATLRRIYHSSAMRKTRLIPPTGNAQAWVLFVLLLLSLLRVAAGEVYFITDIGTFGGQNSSALAINVHGEVVGWAEQSNGLRRATLYRNGVLTDLGTVAGSSASGAWAEAHDINDSGQVVGVANDGAYNYAFLHSATGMISLMNFRGEYFSADASYANSINNWGAIVGRAVNTNGREEAFIFTNNTLTPLGTLGYSSDAVAINNAGQAVGSSINAFFSTHACLFSGGGITDLYYTRVTPRIYSAFGINDAGTFVGKALLNSRFYPCIGYGTIPGLGGINGGTAFAINERGFAVGSAAISGTRWHAFVYDGATKDLNNLISPNSGWELIEARDINNQGQIVGYGYHGGQTRGFLLEPRPRMSISYGNGQLRVSWPRTNQAIVLTESSEIETTSQWSIVSGTRQWESNSTSVSFQPGRLRSFLRLEMR
jgi:probable HAF family extracellular repeat protein